MPTGPRLLFAIVSIAVGYSACEKKQPPATIPPVDATAPSPPASPQDVTAPASPEDVPALASPKDVPEPSSGASTTTADAPVEPEAAPTEPADAQAEDVATPTDGGLDEATTKSTGGLPEGIDPNVPGVAPLKPPLRAAHPKKARAAALLNTEGKRLATRRKYERAVAKFKQALQLDQSSGARYNLMTAFFRLGRMDEALGVLAQFKQPGCTLCMLRLVGTREDKALTEFRSDPRYEALLADVGEVQLPDFEKLTEKLLKGLAKGDKRLIARVVKKGHFVTLVRKEKRIVEGPGGAAAKPRGWKNTVGYLDSTAQVESYKWPTAVHRRLKCFGRCCNIRYEKRKCGYYRITKVCFWPTSSKRAVPNRIYERFCEIEELPKEAAVSAMPNHGPWAEGSW